jgi:PLP dependent protein
LGLVIPNLYSIHTLASTKTATSLNKYIPPERTTSLNVLIQINTSGEDSKSGLDPLLSPADAESELQSLAKHIITECPKLHLQGLMTIGALEQSLSGDDNKDFEVLKKTASVLQEHLTSEGFDALSGKWGQDGRLLLSMGMSGDFEAAIKAGSDIVRVGSSIFGERPKKR